MEEKLKILHVEDLDTDAELIKREIVKSGIQFLYKIVDTKDEYIKAINEFKPDIILSDYTLPSFNGMQAIKIREEIAKSTPFILITGTINEETAVEVMKAGADDYLIKEHLTRIGEAIKSSIKKREMSIQKQDAEEKVRVFSRIVEQSPFSIIITDAEGNIQFVNSKFISFTQFASDEVIGNKPNIFNPEHTSPENLKVIWDTLHSHNIWRGEFINMKKDGTKFWEDATISPLLSSSGTISNIILTFEDITEKKKMIDDLIIAKEKAEENDRLKTAFLHNISHEIRTPMNAIVGFSDLLDDVALSAEERKNYVEIIIHNSTQLLSIINDIVNIATIEAGQERAFMKKVSLKSVCKHIYEQFTLQAKNRNLALSFNDSYINDEIEIITDETKVKQILTNLMTNAIKFTDSGLVDFGCRVDNDFLEFYVKDTGIGVPYEKQTEIFERFHQLNVTEDRLYRGSGLGLSISKAYVQLLGGKMWLKSSPGKGSTFYFTIPFIKPAD
jgi:PAS domain S-box-containing protein